MFEVPLLAKGLLLEPLPEFDEKGLLLLAFVDLDANGFLFPLDELLDAKGLFDLPNGVLF